MPPIDPEEVVEIYEGVSKSKIKRYRLFLLLILIDIVLIGVAIYVWFITSAVPVNEPIEVLIEPGKSISAIVDTLSEKGIVRSSDALYLILLGLHRDAPIKAGIYTFTEPQNAFAVADYMTNTTPSDELVKVTFPEGMRAKDYAVIAAQTLPEVDAAIFTQLAEANEGYLWPETYLVRDDFTDQQLLDHFLVSYDEATEDLRAAIDAHSLSEYEILILASIIEREANDPVSMKMVSGILQNRIEIGMALQADASIEYVLDAPIGELKEGELAKNLRGLDSPYNTYLYTGLPPTPIGNPGRDAIEAVLLPIPSENLFYITGTDGVFYYAETFDQHRLNISRHLR